MGDNKFNFQKLTPINAANIEIYQDAIDFVFNNNDLKNIALSGAYSAGKSSVLESYKENHKDKKFVHISLAHFELTDIPTGIDTIGSGEKNSDNITISTNEQENFDNGAVVKESILEGKILNQLLHQIHPRRIPQTNFRMKHRVSFIRIAFMSLLFVAITISLIHLFLFDSWSNYVNSFSAGRLKEIFLLSTKSEARLISGIICGLTLTVFIYSLLKMQINKGLIKRFGTDKLEIEIFEESKDSYFDKYLNEVIYLFDRSRADVIVFEDMDRYNANRIFQRLREVNTLINVQRSERAKSKLLRKCIQLTKKRLK